MANFHICSHHDIGKEVRPPKRELKMLRVHGELFRSNRQ